MKKFFAVFVIIFLFGFKIFSDCYFSFDGPSIVTLQDWPGNTESAYFASAVAGFSFPFYRKDNFQEYKTSYYLAAFAETQFTGRWRSKENSTNTKFNKSEAEIHNDLYVSAGLDVFQIFRPKISYGFLTKDVYASIFCGVPLPLLGAKFLSNSDNFGFQACFGFEPIWNITSNDSSSKPFYFNYRANFKIYLDFSRRNRFANYTENQRQIQIKNAEEERRIKEKRAEQERVQRQKQKEADEKKAKELGFSSVEDYYTDLKNKERVKKRQSFDNFYNQVLYENGIPLEIGDIFTISSGYIKVVDRIVENNGYTYLVSFVSSAAENSIDYARSFGAYGGGFKHCFYITTKKPLNLIERTELTTYERYVTNRYELKLMCAGKSQYQRNYQDVDCYVFVGTE